MLRNHPLFLWLDGWIKFLVLFFLVLVLLLCVVWAVVLFWVVVFLDDGIPPAPQQHPLFILFEGWFAYLTYISWKSFVLSGRLFCLRMSLVLFLDAAADLARTAPARDDEQRVQEESTSTPPDERSSVDNDENPQQRQQQQVMDLHASTLSPTNNNVESPQESSEPVSMVTTSTQSAPNDTAEKDDAPDSMDDDNAKKEVTATSEAAAAAKSEKDHGEAPPPTDTTTTTQDANAATATKKKKKNKTTPSNTKVASATAPSDIDNSSKNEESNVTTRLADTIVDSPKKEEDATATVSTQRDATAKSVPPLVTDDIKTEATITSVAAAAKSEDNGASVDNTTTTTQDAGIITTTTTANKKKVRRNRTRKKKTNDDPDPMAIDSKEDESSAVTGTMAPAPATGSNVKDPPMDAPPTQEASTMTATVKKAPSLVASVDCLMINSNDESCVATGTAAPFARHSTTAEDAPLPMDDNKDETAVEKTLFVEVEAPPADSKDESVKKLTTIPEDALLPMDDTKEGAGKMLVAVKTPAAAIDAPPNDSKEEAIVEATTKNPPFASNAPLADSEMTSQEMSDDTIFSLVPHHLEPHLIKVQQALQGHPKEEDLLRNFVRKREWQTLKRQLERREPSGELPPIMGRQLEFAQECILEEVQQQLDTDEQYRECQFNAIQEQGRFFRMNCFVNKDIAADACSLFFAADACSLFFDILQDRQCPLHPLLFPPLPRALFCIKQETINCQHIQLLLEDDVEPVETQVPVADGAMQHLVLQFPEQRDDELEEKLGPQEDQEEERQESETERWEERPDRQLAPEQIWAKMYKVIFPTLQRQAAAPFWSPVRFEERLASLPLAMMRAVEAQRVSQPAETTNEHFEATFASLFGEEVLQPAKTNFYEEAFAPPDGPGAEQQQEPDAASPIYLVRALTAVETVEFVQPAKTKPEASMEVISSFIGLEPHQESVDVEPHQVTGEEVLAPFIGPGADTKPEPVNAEPHLAAVPEAADVSQPAEAKQEICEKDILPLVPADVDAKPEPVNAGPHQAAVPEAAKVSQPAIRQQEAYDKNFPPLPRANAAPQQEPAAPAAAANPAPALLRGGRPLLHQRQQTNRERQASRQGSFGQGGTSNNRRTSIIQRGGNARREKRRAGRGSRRG